MKFFSFISILGLIAAIAHATTPIFANRWAGEYRGKTYVIDIGRAAIVALPKWKPESGDPKISPVEAWKRARAKLKVMFEDFERFETTGIVLEQVGSEDGKRFVYIVRFIDERSMSSKHPSGGETPNQMAAWVSTDGAVFSPRVSTGEGDEYVF